MWKIPVQPLATCFSLEECWESWPFECGAAVYQWVEDRSLSLFYSPYPYKFDFQLSNFFFRDERKCSKDVIVSLSDSKNWSRYWIRLPFIFLLSWKSYDRSCLMHMWTHFKIWLNKLVIFTNNAVWIKYSVESQHSALLLCGSFSKYTITKLLQKCFSGGGALILCGFHIAPRCSLFKIHLQCSFQEAHICNHTHKSCSF